MTDVFERLCLVLQSTPPPWLRQVHHLSVTDACYLAISFAGDDVPSLV